MPLTKKKSKFGYFDDAIAQVAHLIEKKVDDFSAREGVAQGHFLNV